MNRCNEKDDFEQIIDKLIGEQKYGEAINYLQKILETGYKNEKALALMEQLKKIMEYQNRDIFGSTNLNMDPWVTTGI
jgi:Tfp pilus assembly protein PilF